MKLTRRTNVLLSESDYLTMKSISFKKGKTMGELIRQAILAKYIKKGGYNKKRLGVFEELEKITKGMNFSGIDYKALVEDGRKY